MKINRYVRGIPKIRVVVFFLAVAVTAWIGFHFGDRAAESKKAAAVGSSATQAMRGSLSDVMASGQK